jgi:hypothetical protein
MADYGTQLSFHTFANMKYISGNSRKSNIHFMKISQLWYLGSFKIAYLYLLLIKIKANSKMANSVNAYAT